MLSILFVWLICGFTFLVFGRLLIDICNFFMKRKDSYGLASTFFLGISLVGTLLSFLSILLPINSFIGYTFFFLAILYSIVLYIRKDDCFCSNWSDKIKSLSLTAKLMIVTTMIIIICCNLIPSYIVDMRLYYLQAILWNESYPVVPGLGNIHGRFGFNSNILLLTSAFSFNNIFPFRIFAILSLSVFVLIGWILTRADSIKELLPKVGLAFFCFLFIFGYQFFISSPSTDVLPNVIVLFILLNAILNTKSYTHNPLLYSVLAVYAVTLKLSVIPVCLFFIYIIVTQLKQKSYKFVFLLFTLSIIVLLPWLVRNVIITGYLIYPFPAIDVFSFDWKIPETLVMEEKEWVSSWSRMPGLSLEEYKSMADGEWLKFWLLRHARGLKLFLFIYCLAAISPLVIFLLKKKRVLNTFEDILPWLVAFCGFIFWFILAPDGRFGLSFIMISAVIPLLYVKCDFITNYKNILYRGIFCVLFLYLTINIVDMFSRFKDESRDILSYLYLPGDIRVIIENNKADFQVMPVGSTDIYIAGNMLCSDHPIPCAPYRINNLEMRGETIKDGFRIKQK